MKDVFDAVLELSHSFRAAGMDGPDVILLRSHEDGLKFLQEVMQLNLLIYSVPDERLKPIEHPDGSVWMEVRLYDMKIRWPARKWAKETGGYVWG